MKRSALVLVVTLMLVSFSGSTGQAGAEVFGPNGKIVFSRDDPNLGDAVTYVVNPDGGDLHLLPVPSPGTSESPRWSPDGSQIAVLSGPCCPATNAVVIVNPDTGTDQVLTMPSPAVETLCWVWSPDAGRLACDGQGNDDPTLNGIYTIRTSDGGGLARVTSIPGGDDVPIDYSPDGNQIVFGRTDPNGPLGRNQALFVVNVDGSGLHRITPWGFSDDDGSWSPDGTKLVFSLRAHAGDGTVQEGIGTANADGTDVQMITTSPTRDATGDWGPLAT